MNAALFLSRDYTSGFIFSERQQKWSTKITCLERTPFFTLLKLKNTSGKQFGRKLKPLKHTTELTFLALL